MLEPFASWPNANYGCIADPATNGWDAVSQYTIGSHYGELVSKTGSAA
jgi:hypothetical protein